MVINIKNIYLTIRIMKIKIKKSGLNIKVQLHVKEAYLVIDNCKEEKINK